MPDSDYIYVEGDPVFVGTAGDHDFEFDEGTSIADSGSEGFCFVEGSSFGGAGGLVDGFESSTLAHYEEGQLGDVSITTSPVFEDSHAMVFQNATLDSGAHVWDTDYDVPPGNYPEPGQTMEARMYFKDGSLLNTKLGFLWAVQPDGKTRNSPPLIESYSIEVRPFNPDITIRRYMSPNGESEDLGTFTFSSWNHDNEWVRLQVNWEKNGTISGVLYDAADNVLVRGEGNDPNTPLDAGSVGYFRESGGPYYLDNYRIVG